MDKLTLRQRAFCDYYLETGNATEAYKKAGYKNYKSAGVEANKTLNNPKIRQYLDEKISAMEDERIAKPKEVLEYLTRVMRGEEKDQFDLDAPLNERTKAAELLGKRFRLFTESIDLTANVGVNIIDDLEGDEE